MNTKESSPQERTAGSGSTRRPVRHRGGEALPGRPLHAPSANFYRHVARGYDLIAHRYDEVEGRNEIGERVRSASREEALRVFGPGDRILELGCGTGRDAVLMAKHGVRVLATDLSPSMVAATQARAAREGVGGLVDAVVCPAARAARLERRFDGVYSNGAVLNLEPDLAGLFEGLGQSVRPGGRAVLTAANRVSLFELAVYPLFLRPRKAFRKLSHSVPIPVSRKGDGSRYVVPTAFYTPRELLRYAENRFKVEYQRAFQLLSPPWNMVDLYRTYLGAVEVLESLEDRISTWRLFRDLGAIYLFTLRRMGD